jgi:hypothetical protein
MGAANLPLLIVILIVILIEINGTGPINIMTKKRICMSVRHPAGMRENSPIPQPRDCVTRRKRLSPAGTIEYAPNRTSAGDPNCKATEGSLTPRRFARVLGCQPSDRSWRCGGAPTGRSSAALALLWS